MDSILCTKLEFFKDPNLALKNHSTSILHHFRRFVYLVDKYQICVHTLKSIVSIDVSIVPANFPYFILEFRKVSVSSGTVLQPTTSNHFVPQLDQKWHSRTKSYLKSRGKKRMWLRQSHPNLRFDAATMMIRWHIWLENVSSCALLQILFPKKGQFFNEENAWSTTGAKASRYPMPILGVWHFFSKIDGFIGFGSTFQIF